jgi:hypothetical protein
MQNLVTVSGPVSFATQYRATRAVVARSKVTLLSYGFFVGVPVLALAGMLVTRYDISRPSVLGLPTWMALLLGPVFVFAFLPLCHGLNVSQMRRKNASLHGTLTWPVSAEGYESHGGYFDVRLRWAAIHRAVETKDFFLFYIAAATAHFIPKGCVTSAEQLHAARTIIREALGDRASLQAA